MASLDQDQMDYGALPSREPSPSRPHKTHLSEAVNAALAKLPKFKKLSMNKAKESRNEDRELKHAQFMADPVRFPVDASDTSSLLTVSSAGSSHTCAGLFGKFSPGSRSIFANLFGKRQREVDAGDDSPEQKAKRQYRDTSDEVELVPGAATNHGFHQYHYDLDKYHVYQPLSLFTNTNLSSINYDAANLLGQHYNHNDYRGLLQEYL